MNQRVPNLADRNLPQFSTAEVAELAYLSRPRPGPMTARGLDVSGARTRRTPWVAARIRPGVTGWVLPWLGVGAQVSGLLTAYRPRFTIEPSGIVHAPSTLGFQAGVGVVFRNRRTW